MNLKHLALAAIAALLTSGAAMAHGGHGDRYHRHDRHGYHDRYDRAHERAGYRREYYRGAGPYHDIYSGARLPRHYWHREHWVGNWRGHHIPRPPHNHVWVRSGNGDYMLVSLRSGIVKRIIVR